MVKEIENIAVIVFFSETKGGRIWASSQGAVKMRGWFDIFDQALTEEVKALQQGKKKVRDLSSLDCHAEVTPVGWPSREDILYEILAVGPCDSLSWVCAKVVNNPRLSLKKRKSVLQELLLQGHLQPQEYDAALNYEMD